LVSRNEFKREFRIELYYMEGIMVDLH